MTGLCVGLATFIQLSLPISQFTLSWVHSVEKIPWEEDYRVEQGGIIAVSARVRGTGAGMEIPDNAVYTNGIWEYSPQNRSLERLRLTRSSFTADYKICWVNECHTLTDLLGPAPDGTPIELFACPSDSMRKQDKGDSNEF